MHWKDWVTLYYLDILTRVNGNFYLFQFQRTKLLNGPDVETGTSTAIPQKKWLHFISPIFVQALTLTFLAEWGDRSQLTTIVLAAREVSSIWLLLYQDHSSHCSTPVGKQATSWLPMLKVWHICSFYDLELAFQTFSMSGLLNCSFLFILLGPFPVFAKIKLWQLSLLPGSPLMSPLYAHWEYQLVYHLLVIPALRSLVMILNSGQPGLHIETVLKQQNF